MENKINSIKNFKDELVRAQEKDLSFKSACEGMGMREDSNATDHVLRDRNRDISSINKIIREEERKTLQKLTKPPKSLYYTNEHGQSFIDEAYAKAREKKAFWGGVIVTALAAIFIAATSKKKGGDKE